MGYTPIVINSAKSLETASNQDDIHNPVSEAESLTEIELTEALQERELHLEPNSDFMLDEALKKQIASPTSSATENKEILEQLSSSEVWRDRHELSLLESPPDPRYSEQYIRCDTLCLPEQISLSKRRIEICSGLISEYRDRQSKREPTSEQENLLEKLVNSREREIAVEQQYLNSLVVNLQNNVERDAAPGGLPQKDCSNYETVSNLDAPEPLRAKSSAKDLVLVPVLEQLTLDQLASAINKEHQLFQGNYKSSLLHAYMAGQFLLTAKSKVKESTTGRWLLWLRQNCSEISDRTARAYMQIFRKWEKIEQEKSATVADFGVKGALKLLGGGKKSSFQDSKPPQESKPSNGEPDVLEAEWEDDFSSPDNISTSVNTSNKVNETVLSKHYVNEKKMTKKNKSMGLNTKDSQRFTLIETNLAMEYNSSTPSMADNTFETSSATIPNNLDDIGILLISNIKYLSVQQLSTIIETFEDHLKAETFNRLVIESIPQDDVPDLCNKCLESMDEQAHSRLAVDKIKFSSLSNPSLNLLNQESQRILDERTALF